MEEKQIEEIAAEEEEEDAEDESITLDETTHAQDHEGLKNLLNN